MPTGSNTKKLFGSKIPNEMFKYLKKTNAITYIQSSSFCGLSHPIEAVEKSVFKKNIEACRCQLQSMFRINKQTQSLEVITEQYRS